MAMPARRGFRPGQPRRGVRGGLAGVLTLGLAGMVTLAGCGGGAAAEPQHTGATPGHTASVKTARATQGARAAVPSPAERAPAAAKSCPATVLAGLSEAQRVGQLFLVGLPGNDVAGSVAAAITGHHYGSAIFGANSGGGVAGARKVSDAVQALATRPATGGVRFFVAANQEGGEVQALKGPGISAIPSALSQGTDHVAALRKLATVWGHQLRAAGGH